MNKQTPKVMITSSEDSPKVLIIGQKDFLTTQVLEALEKKGCQVFLSDRVIKDLPKVDYIFQFQGFKNVKKLLEKAFKDKTRYLLIEKDFYSSKLAKAETEVFQFNKKGLDARILKINQSSLAEPSFLVKQILKTMFSRTHVLPSATKAEPIKAERKKQSVILNPVLNLIQDCFRIYPCFRRDKYRFQVKPGMTRTSWLFNSFKILPIFFIALFILLPYFFYGLEFLSGLNNLRSFEEKFFTGNLESAKKDVVSAQTSFVNAKKISQFLPLFNIGQRFSFFGQTLSETGKAAINVSQIAYKFSRIVLEEEEGLIDERLKQLQVEVENLEKQISLTQAIYKDLNLQNFENISFFSLGEQLKKLAEFLDSGKEYSQLVKSSLPLVSEFLGLNNDKNYLILFQNNMELRPGGGFIGSYGLARFQDGIFTDLKTYDVYTADGQLKGHVEPPVPIREYLDQPHFFLRDSNFSPDFGVNAQQAAWFLEKEMKQNVDGVMAIDLSFVGKLLESLGGVFLADYNQEITTENLFLKAQTLIQAEFFPGSTQKSDFLGTLAQAIFNRAKLGKLPWFKLGQGIKQSFEEKHAQIFLFDEKGQKLVEELGWDGRIKSSRFEVRGSRVFEDYLMIVEANLGVNKANYFLTRKVALKTDFSDQAVSHFLSISYQNTSPGETFPGGVYKNYLRVFVPQEAVLESVAFPDGEAQIEPVDTEQEGDKQSWGVLVEISPGETKKIEFQYALDQQELSPDNQFSYELFFQKQAGTDQDPLSLSFNYPKNWQAKKTNFSATSQNKSLIYKSDLAVDRIFAIDFLQKKD
ncbi:DUF4012 domain-containing protein [Candidatus Microgenomates bacterium]|nr:DUF4012 domain-containing protein [Candidatus Microgenomates bacterium]